MQEMKCKNCGVPMIEGSYGPVCQEDRDGNTTPHEWGLDFKRILDRLRKSMEFHDDSEVHWDQLHHAPADILEGGDPSKCAVCGNDLFDDRWHLMYSVTTRNERFGEQARIYEKILHKQRRELHAESMKMVHKQLFFGESSTRHLDSW